MAISDEICWPELNRMRRIWPLKLGTKKIRLGNNVIRYSNIHHHDTKKLANSPGSKINFELFKVAFTIYITFQRFNPTC